VKLIFENWRKFLNEKTRAAELGVELPSQMEEISKYVADPPTHYMQFSDINKLGIKPQSTFATPVGIYSYPLTSGIYKQFKAGTLPFAKDRKYVIVFEAENPSKLIFNRNKSGDTDEDNSGVPEPKFWEYVKRLLALNTKFSSLVKDQASKSKRNPHAKRRYDELGLHNIPNDILYVIWSDAFWDALDSTNADSRYTAGYLWRLTQVAAAGNPRAWRTIFAKLGIEGWVDLTDAGVVHDAEPTQGVFFAANYVDLSEVFRNPLHGSPRFITNKYLPVFKALQPLIPEILQESGLDAFISPADVIDHITPGRLRLQGASLGHTDPSRQPQMASGFWRQVGNLLDDEDGVPLPKGGPSSDPALMESLRNKLIVSLFDDFFERGTLFLRVLKRDPTLKPRARDVSSELKKSAWALYAAMGLVDWRNTAPDLSTVKGHATDWLKWAQAPDGAEQFAESISTDAAPWYLGAGNELGVRLGTKMIKAYGK